MDAGGGKIRGGEHPEHQEPGTNTIRGGGAIRAGRANTDGAGTMARPDTLRRSHLGPFSQRGLVRVGVDGFPLVRDAPGC